MNVLFCVVIYKLDFDQSATLNSIIKLKTNDVGLLVFDNSPSQKTDDEISNFRNNGFKFFDYMGFPENLPLSKLYNKAINFMIGSDFDYICLLDHDSLFESSFVSELNEILSIDQPDLILPQIIFKNKIISPTKKYFLKGFYFKDLKSGFIKSSYLSAINSGMIINRNYFVNSGFYYDERLDFYGTDDYFMMKLNRFGAQVYIMDYKIIHDLTLSTLNTVFSLPLLKSYKSMIKAWSILYQDRSFFVRLLVKAYSFIHNIYMVVRYRNLGFLCFLKK